MSLLNDQPVLNSPQLQAAKTEPSATSRKKMTAFPGVSCWMRVGCWLVAATQTGELRGHGHGRQVKVSAESNVPFTVGVAWERARKTSWRWPLHCVCAGAGSGLAHLYSGWEHQLTGRGGGATGGGDTQVMSTRMCTCKTASERRVFALYHGS